MPMMCDSSQSSSPSLIKLRQFRFQKKQFSPRQATATTSQNVKVSQEEDDTNSMPTLSPVVSRKEIDVIPETPESERLIEISSSSDEMKNGHFPESPRSEKSDKIPVITISSDAESPCCPTINRETKNLIDSDSDNESKHYSASNSSKKNSNTVVDNDLLTDKERCLRVLMDNFPHADIMEMQDILVSCDWDIGKATEVVQNNPGNSDTLEFSKFEMRKGTIDTISSGDSVEGWLSKSSACLKTYGRLKKDFSEDAKPVISDDSDSERRPEMLTNQHNQKNHESIDDLYQLKDVENETINHVSPQKRKSASEKLSSDEETTRIIKNRNFLLAPKRKRLKKVRAGSDDDDNDYHEENVYDSDASDDLNDVLTPARASVMCFFQEASLEELLSVPGCSKRKADAILNCRPFVNWLDLVSKFGTCKYLSSELLNGARNLINTREVITKLMQRCQRISEETERVIEYLMKGEADKMEGYIKQQPSLLNNRFTLAPYQILGLNWLVLMHKKNINGILADEMGLGKTIQAIAFLAHIKEQNEEGPFLIIVPSSTLDNWLRELRLWLPSANVLCYHGPQDERRVLRHQIMNDEVDDFDVLVTTYTMVTSSAEDRSMFKHLDFHYVIFDEAHMLKNMRSQRYQSLMRIRAKRRLLLTGTPLQNNLAELMSLLIFVMPDMFIGKIDQVKQMFSTTCKSEESRSMFERERIEHAKRIMKPFLLRRLKSEVLKQLPPKCEETRLCPMSDTQQEDYDNLVFKLSTEVQEHKGEKLQTSGIGMMMQLRKLANHPLLIRKLYTDEKLLEIAELMLKEPTHREADPDIIFEDMQLMSDFELHHLCLQYQTVSSFRLAPDVIVKSGKFEMLDEILPESKEKGGRILIFSQFTMMLDILEEYMNIKEYRFLRMDGSVPVAERQELIDQFNDTSDIFVFLLSTRAGGLGINLTAANIVLIHDIDFNPYNDKQAEDRCHRVGQTKEVKVIRLISKATIEEHILRCATEKLKLERDVTANENEGNEEDNASVDHLLRSALGL